MAPNILATDTIPFFSVIDVKGIPVMFSVVNVIETSEGIVTTYFYKQAWKVLETNRKEFYAFPRQWIKSCAAFNGTSGHYQVVANGVFVKNTTLPEYNLSLIHI